MLAPQGGKLYEAKIMKGEARAGQWFYFVHYQARALTLTLPACILCSCVGTRACLLCLCERFAGPRL